MEHKEKRKVKKPIPDDPLKYLNEAQIHTYRLIQGIGWHIKFIRRLMHQSPVCVMTNSDETMLAVLEENEFQIGQSDITLRGAEKFGQRILYTSGFYCIDNNL